ncbi:MULTISPECIES: hypothetical protein [Agrobacterium]|uniref:hypothetical protein n=1 Tax=Agrobacterium TaxID=357 RepID=UPI00277F2308|nr:hypothetical protein [Agrobacterium sp. SORGH_AS_0745]MDP9762084.1 hypothetical protein [Agrobacterium tumefaciens]MDQ1220627.1 hypothetical protein [Agrobacterium sp. SORGH_AS_0745]
MALLPYAMKEQVAAMRATWPAFSHRTFGNDAVIWRGTLKPLMRPYEIKVEYCTDWVISGPRVRVISPTLTRLPDNSEGSLPHVYNRDRDPFLCLFDPAQDEWSGWDLVSETTIPWTIDWLACYEFWLMTGVWEGGGRHPPSTGNRHNVENHR